MQWSPCSAYRLTYFIWWTGIDFEHCHQSSSNLFYLFKHVCQCNDASPKSGHQIAAKTANPAGLLPRRIRYSVGKSGVLGITEYCQGRPLQSTDFLVVRCHDTHCRNKNTLAKSECLCYCLHVSCLTYICRTDHSGIASCPHRRRDDTRCRNSDQTPPCIWHTSSQPRDAHFQTTSTKRVLSIELYTHESQCVNHCFIFSICIYLVSMPREVKENTQN